MIGFQKSSDPNSFRAVLAHTQSLPLCKFLQCLIADILDGAGFYEVGEEAVCPGGLPENNCTPNLRSKLGVQQVQGVLEYFYLEGFTHAL